MTHRTEAEWNALRDQRDDNNLDDALIAELNAHDAGSDYTIVAKCGRSDEHGAHAYNERRAYVTSWCGGNVGGAIIERPAGNGGCSDESPDYSRAQRVNRSVSGWQARR